MDDEIQQRLGRIEASGNETATALHAQGELLQTAVRQLAEIVDLLTPKEGSRDGVPLDELLAHMIRQNAEQLALAHRLVEAVNRLEQNLPRQVAEAVGGRVGQEGATRT